MSATTKTIEPGAVTEGCRYCWMCRQACPVGHVTYRETYTPHAWALTIESVKRGQLTWNGETVDVLYACADCGLCRAHCATDRPLPDAIAEARADVAARGLAPAVVYEIDKKLRAAGSGHADADKATGEVMLYVGEAGTGGQAAVDAATRLLAASGIKAVPMGAGLSNGVLASSLGLADTASLLARDILSAVSASGAREVLVLSPGDRWAFQTLYRERLGLAWPEAVRVREIVEVLDEAQTAGRLRLKPATGGAAYAYHDPCHSARIERDHAAPRRLLEAVLGTDGARQLFWREGRAHPCGAVGGLTETHPDIAARLAEARFADAQAAGAGVIVTEDPGCASHLKAAARGGIEVRGLFELLAGQL